MSGARGDAKNAPYPATSGAECKLIMPCLTKKILHPLKAYDETV
jgi:hypothetical protein